jgi:eukaryotic-like serine/threonine-protein kinase
VPSERWNRLEQVFAEALALPLAARHAFLQRSCGDDADLRSEIDDLLRSHDAPGVLDSAPHAADAVAPPPSLACAACLGPWRIEKLIGRGGMGEVYLATRADAAFEQRAALKLLRYEAAGEMARFHAERRILAKLEHPGIARLLDGGMAADGRPYTVMEYVEGHSLTEYCREHRSTLRERLALFAQVCEAVAFAHRNLVIHRDLKPDNIVVNAQGEVKLLDFGIAKLLDAAAAPTTGDVTIAPFTPDYAAPEQLSGQPVTTATDIYALGVLLFELLTGERPLRTRGRPSTQALQLLLDRTAPAPSRIAQAKADAPLPARLLVGDLDAIVSKCLRKESAHRYETVDALKRDIQAHLRNQPVLAREGARWYVFGRAVYRYRWAVVGISILIITLAAGLAGTLWQARRAETQAERANTIRDFLISLFGTAEADKPRHLIPTPEGIVEQGGDRILTDRDMPAETKADLLGVLSRVALRMGTDAQKQELTKALLLLNDDLYKKTDPRWISARQLRASALYDGTQYAETVALLEPMRDALLQRGDALAIEVLQILIEAMSHQGGRIEEALTLQRQVRALAMQDAQAHPRSTLKALIAEADLLGNLSRFKEALERGEIALAFWKARNLPADDEVLWLHSNIANSAMSLGDTVRAEAGYREAITLSEQLHKRPHQDTAWFVGLLGSYLVWLGRLDEAEPYVQRGLSMRRDLLGEAHPATLFAVSVLARLRAAQNRTDEALAVLSEGVTVCARTGLQHYACVRVLQTRAQMHTLKSEFDAAEADLNAAIDLQRQISGEDSQMVASQFEYLAELQRTRGRFDEAISTAEHALAVFDKTGGGQPGDVLVARFQRAWANLELGKHQAALDEVAEVEAQFSAQFPGNLPVRVNMLSVKARALSRLNRVAEARQTAAAALTLIGERQIADAIQIAGLKRLAATGQGY